MPVRYDHLTKEELDRQLSPSRSAKDAAGVLSRHEAETAALWTLGAIEAERDIAYGQGPVERFDIVRPQGAGPFPCLIFIHGGFWQEGSKAGSGFAAAALAKAGWASALIGYPLAPQARLREIVDAVGRAVTCLAEKAETLRLDPSRLVIAGHSAGGHMAAAIICGKAGKAATDAIAGAVLISGVYDLAPIAASYVNDKVGMDERDIAELSLLDATPLRDIPIHIVVGADEPAAFLDQSRALNSAWSGMPHEPGYREAPGRDHFDILDELADSSSPGFNAIVEMGA